jgi:hypothetical protein
MQILVDGKPVHFEKSRAIARAAKAISENLARRFVRETVIFMAIKKGVHENMSPEEGLFAKAALWFMQEEDILYRSFAESELAQSE